MSENKTDTTQQAAPAEAPKPTLADGLFKPFTLGSTLEQAAHGNVMHNLKPNMMDYEKQYQGSTKNQSISEEELAKLDPKELDEGGVKKADSVKVGSGGVRIGGPSRKIGVTPKTVAAAYAKKSMDEEISEVPEDQREAVLAELDKRIDEAKKSNKEDEVQLLEKAKEKAKKCYGPQMDHKQPKASDLK